MAEHGTRARYSNGGCRCEACTTANAEYSRRHYNGLPQPSPPKPETPLLDLLGVESPDWYEHAECRGAPQELFFPGQGEPTQPAKEMCAACPVSVECLAWALDHGEKHGIWGGTSERERRRLRKTWEKVA